MLWHDPSSLWSLYVDWGGSILQTKPGTHILYQSPASQPAVSTSETQPTKQVLLPLSSCKNNVKDQDSTYTPKPTSPIEMFFSEKYHMGAEVQNLRKNRVNFIEEFKELKKKKRHSLVNLEKKRLFDVQEKADMREMTKTIQNLRSKFNKNREIVKRTQAEWR